MDIIVMPELADTPCLAKTPEQNQLSIDKYNEKLSQKRAESVVNYLIEHGIDAERLTAKGYGESSPKTILKKVAEKYPFLKENDVLTEQFINSIQSEEEQEICHQLNRRTEFRVLRTTYKLYE